MTVRALFEAGIKPAWLVRYKKAISRGVYGEPTPIFKDLAEEYPYIIFEHRNSVLFFHDELTKEWFEANGCECFYAPRLGKWIQDFKQDVLGLTLGYPPSAVQFFKGNTHRRPVAGDRASVDYYGIRFVCHPQDIHNCLNWLKKNRPVPDFISSRGRIMVTQREPKIEPVNPTTRKHTVKHKVVHFE